MPSRILIAMDGSEVSEQALEYAIDAHPEAALTVITVVGEPSAMFGQATSIALAEDPQQSMQELAQPVVDRAREIAADHDMEIDIEIRVGHPAREILKLADGFDTLIVGSHGGSMADRMFVGNVTEKLVRRSPVPVTVVR